MSRLLAVFLLLAEVASAYTICVGDSVVFVGEPDAVSAFGKSQVAGLGDLGERLVRLWSLPLDGGLPPVLRRHGGHCVALGDTVYAAVSNAVVAVRGGRVTARWLFNALSAEALGRHGGYIVVAYYASSLHSNITITWLTPDLRPVANFSLRAPRGVVVVGTEPRLFVAAHGVAIFGFSSPGELDLVLPLNGMAHPGEDGYGNRYLLADGILYRADTRLTPLRAVKISDMPKKAVLHRGLLYLLYYQHIEVLGGGEEHVIFTGGGVVDMAAEGDYLYLYRYGEGGPQLWKTRYIPNATVVINLRGVPYVATEELVYRVLPGRFVTKLNLCFGSFSVDVVARDGESYSVDLSNAYRAVNVTMIVLDFWRRPVNALFFLSDGCKDATGNWITTYLPAGGHVKISGVGHIPKGRVQEVVHFAVTLSENGVEAHVYHPTMRIGSYEISGDSVKIYIYSEGATYLEHSIFWLGATALLAAAYLAKKRRQPRPL